MTCQPVALLQVFTAVPARTVAFRGSTAPAASTPAFDMDSELVYPMEGGTALLTFEEEEGETIVVIAWFKTMA